MRRSTVVGSGGKSVEDNIRTSYGTFLRHARPPVLTDTAPARETLWSESSILAIRHQNSHSNHAVSVSCPSHTPGS